MKLKTLMDKGGLLILAAIVVIIMIIAYQAGIPNTTFAEEFSNPYPIPYPAFLPLIIR
jgi:hypothetical protein